MSALELVLVGGGGHCESVIGALRDSELALAGVLDASKATGDRVLDLPVLGGDEQLDEMIAASRYQFLITVGQLKSAAIRRRLFEQIQAAGGQLAVAISGGGHLAPTAKIGAGSVVMRGAIVNERAVVGENAIINNMALIEHGSTVGAHSHIATGAIVNGDCTVGGECLIGSRAVLVQGVSICDGAVIGAGSVVRESIPEPGVYAGVPARRIA